MYRTESIFKEFFINGLTIVLKQVNYYYSKTSRTTLTVHVEDKFAFETKAISEFDFMCLKNNITLMGLLNALKGKIKDKDKSVYIVLCNTINQLNN